jgi:hypothetical protein
MACGQKFNSCKTASKHKCPKSKVERVRKEAAIGQASQATSVAKADKPPATPTPHAPTPPPHIMPLPPVTGDLEEKHRTVLLRDDTSGLDVFNEEEAKVLLGTGLWKLG